MRPSHHHHRGEPDIVIKRDNEDVIEDAGPTPAWVSESIERWRRLSDPGGSINRRDLPLEAPLLQFPARGPLPILRDRTPFIWRTDAAIPVPWLGTVSIERSQTQAQEDLARQAEAKAQAAEAQRSPAPSPVTPKGLGVGEVGKQILDILRSQTVGDLSQKVVGGLVDIGLGALERKLTGGATVVTGGGSLPLTLTGGGSIGGPLGIPGVEIVGDPGQSAGFHHLRWDKKLEKWVPHTRRRRRRRLLTPTDLNDLAALKTIAGGGEQLKFAIMKAVRR